jgi:endonuclease YncB( thermonuclease family)
MKRTCLLILVFLCACTPALAWNGTVESVDGCDAVIVKETGSNKSMLVKLYGVACPAPPEGGKPGQPHAEESLALLRELMPIGLPVVVHDMRLDVLGREKGSMITLPDRRIVQAEILRAGLAWIAPLHCGNCREWKRLEKSARENAIGLWRDKDAVAPWEWRP